MSPFILLILLQSVLAYKTILFTRHGARSPKTYTEIDTKYLWTIPAEDLTSLGLNQHTQIGQRNSRQEIMDKQGNCIYEQLEIQASTTQRVIMSTIGFIKGLCPNNYADILHRYFQEYYAQYSTNSELLSKILQSDFKNPLELDLHYFERPNDFLFHGHKKTVCPALKQLKKDIEKSADYLKKEAEFLARTEFNEVADIIKAAYPSQDIKKKNLKLADIDDIYDDYYSNYAEGFNFPNPTQSAIKFMQEVVAYLNYYVDNSQMLEHQSSLSEPFKWLIQQLNNDLSFSWYSGHDSNQVAILSVIANEQFIVPFASRLELVVFGDYVNVYFNDVQLYTKLCPSKINCRIGEVVLYSTQYIAQDLNKLCQIQSEN